MNTLKILSIFLFVNALSSCKKDDDADLKSNDYLIFGHYYGECFGETCVETYKLTNSKLFEDIIDVYAGNGPFDFKELTNEEYEQVKDLIEYFPAELLDTNEESFGCPDCADQGGLFIQYAHEGEINSWRIDQSKNQVPAYLHIFMDKVNEKITMID